MPPLRLHHWIHRIIVIVGWQVVWAGVLCAQQATTDWGSPVANGLTFPDAAPDAAKSQEAGLFALEKGTIFNQQVGTNQETGTDVQTEANNWHWLEATRVGYDSGFVIASQRQLDLQAGNFPYRLRLGGWGQLRHTVFDSDGTNPDLNQFQLARGRLVFSGNAFIPEFSYFVQLDGRSSSGDDMRLLDYYLSYDLGHHKWGWEPGTLGFRTGKYKMPFTMARYLSGREFEFTDRSMASTFFDVNRSLAAGLYGQSRNQRIPVEWEAAIFNGLVTGGAETGSSGQLDNNFAYSARLFAFPTGEWGRGGLADFEYHQSVATRLGCGFANSQIDRSGATEFASIRVVDSGDTLASILPPIVDSYNVNLFAVDLSAKYCGWSATMEYYLRNINQFEGATIPSLFDHGFWLQLGKFAVRDKLQLLGRWSRVAGNSGTLGVADQSGDELAGGVVWYFREQQAKVTFDASYVNGAPISSSALGISPGAIGWLFRTQIQFAF